MLRFYARLVRQIPRLLLDATGRTRSISAIVVFGLAVSNQKWARYISDGTTGISPWWAAIPVILLILDGLLRANYSEFTSLNNRASEKDNKIAQLEARISPRMEILFDPDVFRSCRMERTESVTGFPIRLFRIGVRNISTTTINEVRVSLERFEPQGANFLPIPLRMMHDHPPEYQSSQRGVTLHPQQIEFVDVAQKRTTENPNEEIGLCYAVGGVPNAVPPRRYKLTLQAVGRDVPACPKEFFVDVDENAGLVFYPV